MGNCSHGAVVRMFRGSGVFLAVALFFLTVFHATRAEAIPTFSREYKTECTTCHTIFPQLNEFGQAFEKNGFVWPGEAKKVKRVSQTEQERRSAEFITLSGIPAVVPVSFLTSVSYLYDDTREDDFDQKRYGAEIFSAGAFGGDKFGYWIHESLGNQSTTSSNSLSGPSNLYFIARHPFGVPVHVKAGKFGPDLSLWKTSLNGRLLSTGYTADGFSATGAQNALEISSILHSRVIAVVGMNDRNNSTDAKVTHSVNDFYGRLGVKFGGTDYHGAEPEVDLDKDSVWDYLSVSVSAFGYQGTSSKGDGVDHDRNRYGLEAEVAYKKTTLMFGAATGETNADTDDPQQSTGVSAEVDYIFNPKFGVAVRYDTLDIDGKERRNVITPGIYYAPLQNFKMSLRVTKDSNPGNSDTGKAEKNTTATVSATMSF